MAVVAAIASAAGKSRNIGVPPHAPGRVVPGRRPEHCRLESTSDANAHSGEFARFSGCRTCSPVEPSSNEFGGGDYAGGLRLAVPGDEPRHLVVQQPVGRKDASTAEVQGIA